jgi:predicted Zn-dependent protease
MPTRIALLAGVLLLAQSGNAREDVKPTEDFSAGLEAYEASDYSKAAELLREAAARNPKNAEVQLLLAKTYYEAELRDAAIGSAERAVSLEPQNSVYHEWLGRVYGDKADHTGPFSAMSLAKKARREFERAVELDERNFSARQALIEFDCSAPGIVGGGQDKARPHIDKIAAMDAAEGHYAEGNCRRQKKDYAAAEVEFDKALKSHPKSTDLIYDIGDYAMKHGQAATLAVVAEEGEKIAPADPRGGFYRAVALVLRSEDSKEAEKLLREYLKHAPKRNNFPPAWRAHEWLGRLYENEQKTDAAIEEYETAVRLEPKSKDAHEGLKRLKKG